MNERILLDLLKLFAFIGGRYGIGEKEVEIVRKFLVSEFNQLVADKYIDKFRAFAQRREQLPGLEELSTRAGSDLTNREKYYMVVRLMELVDADGEITAKEEADLEKVAEVFGISGLTYHNLYEFTTTRAPRKLYHRNLLILSSEIGSARGNFLRKEHLVGYIAILHIEGVEIYLLRYIGNGVAYLNGQNLIPRQVYILNPGSVVRAPLVEPIYYSEIVDEFQEHSPEEYIRFRATDLHYQFATGDVGLRGVTLDEESGNLVALMGASGAGKSTLLNVLNGNLKPTRGRVSINGFDVHHETRELEGVIGYVAQDDLLIEELTVYQNLLFAARLSFANRNTEQIDLLVLEMLEELGLMEISALTVGSPMNKKISGGQRKRLNIALELIRQPAVLFIDEPTSGLSSRDSENVMDLLKELSRQGKLIFVVIHQPSSDIFKMFDSLLVLDTGGYPVFYGNPLKGIQYFREQINHVNSEVTECPTCGNVNPEQLFNILEARVIDQFGGVSNERKISPREWHQRYLATHTFAQPPSQAGAQPTADAPAPAQHPEDEADAEEVFSKPKSNLNRPAWFGQFWLFLKRDFLSKLGNTSYLLVNFLEAPALAVVLAYILRYFNPADSNEKGYTLYHNENLPTYIFVSILVALFIGLTVSAEEILKDRKIRKREAFLHLGRGNYLSAKVAILFAFSALQMGLFVAIGNGLTGIHGLSWEYFVVLFSVACFANMLGLNISATFDNAVTIYILVPILLIPQIVLSGAIVRFDRLNPEISSQVTVPLTGQLMASRWAYEALAVTQFSENAYQKRFFEVDFELSQSEYLLNYWVPEMENRLERARRAYRKKNNERLTDELETLRLGLQDQLAAFRNQEFSFLEQLNPEGFSTDLANRVEQVIKALQVRYGNKQRAALARRDSIMRSLRAKGVDIDSLQLVAHNQRLEELVTNAVSDRQIAEIDNRLVRLSDPVFKLPANPNLLGTHAHFYAPYKGAFGKWFSTFQYNLVIIWLMSLLLYVALYFELFRKLIAFISTAAVRLRHRTNR